MENAIRLCDDNVINLFELNAILWQTCYRYMQINGWYMVLYVSELGSRNVIDDKEWNQWCYVHTSLVLHLPLRLIYDV